MVLAILICLLTPNLVTKERKRGRLRSQIRTIIVLEIVPEGKLVEKGEKRENDS